MRKSVVYRTINELEKRLSHQRYEVRKARINMGNPGYSRKYYNRMKLNARATEVTLNYYYRLLNK